MKTMPTLVTLGSGPGPFVPTVRAATSILPLPHPTRENRRAVSDAVLTRGVNECFKNFGEKIESLRKRPVSGFGMAASKLSTPIYIFATPVVVKDWMTCVRCGRQ